MSTITYVFWKHWIWILIFKGIKILITSLVEWLFSFSRIFLSTVWTCEPVDTMSTITFMALKQCLLLLLELLDPWNGIDNLHRKVCNQQPTPPITLESQRPHYHSDDSLKYCVTSLLNTFTKTVFEHCLSSCMTKICPKCLNNRIPASVNQ